ncbi:GGDEF domain-containing protein [Ruminococcus sp. OA3]|uniref:GGDEF domain-containing protein n=1 Tax=Ruminococcus sp. OA3 TaxID=2914164 RepID=UPI001F0697A3|nr:GGDEF domain-containing protein [Ruminococcus sp. OA3]MCH1983007.1 GGDEF domain-containing protein [Ruminococcus sp. OA3]
MTEEDRIKEVLYKFEDGGLISKDQDKILSCLSDTIIGIGIGEQGFVTSKNDIINVFTAGIKEENEVSHFLDFGRTEIRLLREDMSVLCADVIVTAKCQEMVTQSRFSQSLTLIKEENEWKICCLHASTPIVTEENIDAYPLKFAEKTLQSLRDKIGEEVYAVEEQYRMAVLSDTIAFYIVNFSKDIYEKCQLNSEICAYVEDGTPYEQYAREHISDYVAVEDRESYLKFFLLKNIDRAYQNDEQEVKYEYRMRSGKKGSFIWVMTVIRLITDIVTGERKGIMYVKNIDDSKRQQIVMQKRAEYDTILSIYNKNTFNLRVDSLSKQSSGVFMILDIDDFKTINDTLGHPFGDKVLIIIADILRTTFPEDAVIGRLGGDEFGIFLPEDYGRKQMEIYMKLLYGRISGYLFKEDARGKVSFSVGIAFSKGKSFADFYKDADAALYFSKHGGKNSFSFYED